MNPLAIESLLHLDPSAIVAGIEARFEKDALRIAMFFPACVKRAASLVDDKDTAHQVGDFLAEGSALIAEYIHKGNPQHWGLGDLAHDPFAQCRQDVRAFAHKWALDPKFAEAMG